MPEVKGLTIAIGAATGEFKAGLEDVKSQLGGLGSFAESAMGLLSNPIALATAAVVGIGTAAFQVGMEFDSAFDKIALRVGAMNPQLAGLQEDFSAVFAGVPDDADKVSTAISELSSRLGLAGPALQSLSTELLAASRLLGGDIKSDAAAFGQVVNEWKIDDKSAAMNTLFTAAASAGKTLADFGGQVALLGPSLQTMGLNLDQSIALVAELERTGQPATRVVKELAASEDHGREIIEKMLPQLNAAVATYKEYPKAIEGAAEATDDFGEKWDTFKKQFMEAIEPVGTFFVNLAGWIIDAENWVGSLSQKAADLGEPFREWLGLSDETKKSTDENEKAVSKFGETVKTNVIPPTVNMTDELKKKKIADEAAKKAAEEHEKQLKAQAEEMKKASEEAHQLAASFGDLITQNAIAEAEAKALAGQAGELATAFASVKQPVINLDLAGRGATQAMTELNAVMALIPPVLSTVDAGTVATAAAFASLQSKSKTELETMKTTAETNFNLITASGEATPQQINEAWINMLTARQTALAADGIALPAAEKATLDKLLEEQKTFKEGSTGETGTFTQWGEDVKGILNGLGSDMFQGMFAGEFSLETVKSALGTIRDSFADAFSKPIMNLLTGPDGFVTKGLKVITDELNNIIGKLTGSGGVKEGLEKTFGGTSPSIPGAGGKTPGIPGGATTTASDAAGSTASDVGGAASKLNVASFVMDAVALGVDIFQSFQFAAMNKSLDIIVKHTLQMVNILGGENQDSGISKKLADIQEGVWFGPGVKAVEDFRNKWFDFGLPIFRALETQGAYIQPTLDHFGSEYFGSWGPKFDAIERNTAATAMAVRELQGVQASQGTQINVLQTAIERNTGGLATTIARIPRAR